MNRDLKLSADIEEVSPLGTEGVERPAIHEKL